MSYPSKKHATSVFIGIFIAVAAGLLPGCGKSGPKTVPVSGKVAYGGKPVSIGNVVFQPQEIPQGQPQRPAMGKLEKDGSYRLSTFSKNDGLIPGKYRVVIHSLISGPTPENPTAPHIWAVPERYTSTQATPLETTIPADANGSLEFNFELTD